MTFKMEFNTDNAAFQGDYITQIDHIMDAVMYHLAAAETEGVIYDTNGNKIGKWELNHGA